ncbi:MAG: methylmalonyl-CoA mutase family protein, partial [Flavobacteriales bacterium]
LLKERGAGHIKIFGGGGGTILPDEILELHAYGITRIYHPDDGRAMGLQGMINDLVSKCDFPTGKNVALNLNEIQTDQKTGIAQLISAAENFPQDHEDLLEQVRNQASKKSTPVLGITGTGGAGKSSMVDELVRRFLLHFPDKTIGIISVDPSKKKTGGALLGDRIRMNSIRNPRVYMRSLATRQSNLALSKHVAEAADILKVAGFDLIVLETSGIGQSDTEIMDHSDVSLYIMTPEFGAATQLEKIDMLDFADVVAINKFDKRGALDALRDVRKQYKRNHQLWDSEDESLPVIGSIASQFNDPGTNRLFGMLMRKIQEKCGVSFTTTVSETQGESEKIYIIPPHRTRYLSEISENNRSYDQWVNLQAETADKLYRIQGAIDNLASAENKDAQEALKYLQATYDRIAMELDPKNWAILQKWPQKRKLYKDEDYIFHVRGKEISIKTHTESLSHQAIPKVVTPSYRSWGDILRWVLQENVPGEFPYTSGLYPFKREGEDPTRMFAGEGGPERTNRRFHYVSLNMPAKRLSTAFDSVTLYGHDPALRPDIYGKVGNSGVSICCLDDAKKLYSGFDLCDSKTSVSMTING